MLLHKALVRHYLKSSINSSYPRTRRCMQIGAEGAKRTITMIKGLENFYEETKRAWLVQYT